MVSGVFSDLTYLFWEEEKVIEPGGKAPNFCLATDEGDILCLDDLRGKWMVLYFYSKDNTSG